MVLSQKYKNISIVELNSKFPQNYGLPIEIFDGKVSREY
jgi:hypothetical protein